MKRREMPEPPAPSPERVRGLLAELAAVHARGGNSLYYSPVTKELFSLSDAGAYMVARRLADPTPVTPAELDDLAGRFVHLAEPPT